MDFKDPEEVPEEFKAMAYNATSTKEIKKGDRTISGASWSSPENADCSSRLLDDAAAVLRKQRQREGEGENEQALMTSSLHCRGRAGRSVCCQAAWTPAV